MIMICKRAQEESVNLNECTVISALQEINTVKSVFSLRIRRKVLH